MGYKPDVSALKFRAPQFNRQSMGLSTHVDYERYNPNHDEATHGRKSLADLDYSPLKRVTWASFYMGVLVSMGGFIFGYDTGECDLNISLTSRLTSGKVRSPVF